MSDNRTPDAPSAELVALREAFERLRWFESLPDLEVSKADGDAVMKTVEKALLAILHDRDSTPTFSSQNVTSILEANDIAVAKLQDESQEEYHLTVIPPERVGGCDDCPDESTKE